MANRKRNIQVKFYVTAEEKKLMEQKMAQLQTKRIGAYLRKMAIDGYIIYVDTRDIKEMNKLLSAIGRNINQIAKRVNAGGPTYQADMKEIRERLDQIWQLQRHILLSSVVRMIKVISRLQLMDLPLPGVPNTRPLGQRDCLRSSRIMLLERALRP